MAVQVDREQCIRCAGCVAVCPFESLDYQGNCIVVVPEKCTDCEICIKFCPVGALSLKKKK